MTFNTPEKDTMSRRQFFGEASCKAVGAASLFSTLLNMRMTGTAAAYAAQPGENDYKALVCLFLAGGNDSFNMLVPTGNEEYGEYNRIRADLALAQNTLLPLNAPSEDGREFGVHPSMPEVQQLFNNGDLAFISNVGTLVERTTLDDMVAGRAKLPLGLFSHADQIMQWQTSVPDQRAALGWGGRTADLMHSLNDNQNISMNISLTGSNVFQTGKQSVEYTILPREGSIGIEGYGGNDPWQQLQTASIDSMLDIEYKNLFEKTYAGVVRNAIDSHLLFSGAINSLGAFNTTFSDNDVSKSFEMVAKTIASRQQLGMRRQTFFIMFDGWDHHDEVINNQQQMLGVVSRGLNEFYGALKELGVENDVTTFTASDFARTLTSNGKGSDHAWGGNQMVMGGAVQGGHIYGEYPRLFAGNDLDTGRGRLIPTLSVDEYFSELALWFGVSPADLDIVFPNINRFYTPNGTAPIGFMNAVA